MPAAVETMAYANAVPWHGLGKKISSKSTPEEMLVAAGIDWRVKLLPSFAYDEASGTALDIGRTAVVRETDNRVLTVTGPNWHPLQNEDALGFFKSFTEAGGATLETAGSLREGKIIWALASLHDKFTLNGNDTVKGFLLLTSRHEVGTSIDVRGTGVRVVCENTLGMALNGSAITPVYKQNHLSDFNPEAAKQTVGLISKQFADMKLSAQLLSKMKMSEFEGVRVLARFFQPIPDEAKAGMAANADRADKRAFDKFVESLLTDTTTQSKQLSGVITSVNNAPGAQPTTAWGVLNGVTHWADHVAGRETDARLFNSWLGNTGRVKLQVQSKLMELATTK